MYSLSVFRCTEYDRTTLLVSSVALPKGPTEYLFFHVVFKEEIDNQFSTYGAFTHTDKQFKIVVINAASPHRQKQLKISDHLSQHSFVIGRIPSCIPSSNSSLEPDLFWGVYAFQDFSQTTTETILVCSHDFNDIQFFKISFKQGLWGSIRTVLKYIVQQKCGCDKLLPDMDTMAMERPTVKLTTWLII
jgi:hypothetical protein